MKEIKTPGLVPGAEKFVPTVMYGFANGTVLQQAWVGTLGTIEWRDIPRPAPGKTECVVGHIEMEDEDAVQS
jgi:hypothetical protein